MLFTANKHSAKKSKWYCPLKKNYWLPSQGEDDIEEEIEDEEQEVEEEKVVQGREKVIVLQNSDLSINFAHNNIGRRFYRVERRTWAVYAILDGN